MKQTFAILLLFVQFQCLGQSVSMASSKLEIGQQTTIRYEIALPRITSSVKFEEKSGTVACNDQETGKPRTGFEILSFRDSIAIKNKKWIGIYKVTAWDTGKFIIPSAGILIDDSMYVFDALPFEVVSPPKIAGIDLIETEISFVDYPTDNWAWLKSNTWWLIFLLITLVAIPIFIVNKKRKKKTDFKLNLEPHVKALREIEELEIQKMWEHGELKTHYIQLSYIIRSYLGERFSLNFLEKTTEETEVLLISKGLRKGFIEKLKTILSQSDMVKFAKSTPLDGEIFKITALAKEIITETIPKSEVDA